MKSLLLFSVLLSASSWASTPKIYAIVIGISKYRDNNIENLRFAENDARAFYNFLQSPDAGSIPSENISLLIGSNATQDNVINTITDLFTRSTSDDMLIFYFSGHGDADKINGSGYLLSYDTQKDHEAASALSMDQISNLIGKCQAKLKMYYIDACHAGLFKTQYSKGNAEADNILIAKSVLDNIKEAGPNNAAFLASTAGQEAKEDTSSNHGFFTNFLLKGLQGEADKEHKEDTSDYLNGIVTIGEMADYLSERIPKATNYKQRPAIEGKYDDLFPLSVLNAKVSIYRAISKAETVKSNAAATTDNSDDDDNSEKEIFDQPILKRGSQCLATDGFYNSADSSTTLEIRLKSVGEKGRLLYITDTLFQRNMKFEMRLNPDDWGIGKESQIFKPQDEIKIYLHVPTYDLEPPINFIYANASGKRYYQTATLYIDSRDPTCPVYNLSEPKKYNLKKIQFLLSPD